MSRRDLHELLVVDGYNVIFKTPRYMDLAPEAADHSTSDPFGEARERLVADVAAYAQGRYEPVIVFDAANNVSDERPDFSRGGVRVIFSRTGETADEVIERLVTDSRHEMRAVTVITSDNTIRATVGGIPVTRIGSDVLISDVKALEEDARVANTERNYQHMTVADRLDPATRAKLDRLLGRG